MDRKKETETMLKGCLDRNGEIANLDKGMGENSDSKDMAPTDTCSAESSSVRMDQSALDWPCSRK